MFLDTKNEVFHNRNRKVYLLPHMLSEQKAVEKGMGRTAHTPETVFPIKTFFKYNFLIDF